MRLLHTIKQLHKKMALSKYFHLHKTRRTSNIMASLSGNIRMPDKMRIHTKMHNKTALKDKVYPQDEASSQDEAPLKKRMSRDEVVSHNTHNTRFIFLLKTFPLFLY
jgi:hypothetical protein